MATQYQYQMDIQEINVIIQFDRTICQMLTQVITPVAGIERKLIKKQVLFIAGISITAHIR